MTISQIIMFCIGMTLAVFGAYKTGHKVGHVEGHKEGFREGRAFEQYLAYLKEQKLR